MMWLWLACALAAPGNQKRFEVEPARQGWHFELGWGRDEVAFDLPAADVDADRSEPTWFPRRAFNEHVVDAVVEWGRTVKAVEVTAQIRDGGVLVGVSGPPDAARRTLARAEAVRDEASREWLHAHDFFVMQTGAVSYDHARLVASYAPSLAPVAAALAEGTPTERAFAERALGFVQSIPYEAQRRNGKDPGYRRPLALLYRNRGDCDSKAVLYLGLLRARMPDVPLAVVYVPGHALVGVGLPPGPGDLTFSAGGQSFLYAEPVGPAALPLGQPAKENKKAAKKGEVRVVPR